MRKMLSSILAVTVLLGAVGLCHAQSESKPLVTVSFAGYDKLVADVGMIGRLGGNPNLGKQLEVMALMLPQGEGAKGPLALDAKQPWGTVLMSDGQAPSSYAFLPVTDIKPLIEMVKLHSGQEIKAEKDVYQIPIGAKTMYAVQKGNWAFIADSQEQLDKVAADPAPLLGDLPKRYNLAIRASIKNLPKEYREQLLAQLRAGAEVGMQQLPSESEEEYTIRLNVAKQAVQQLTTLVNDMDDVLLGWNVDSKTKTTYLDFELTARTGTKLADQFAEIKPGKTNFAGLPVPGAAITGNWTGMLTDADVAQAKSALAALRKSVTKELEKQGLAEAELKLASQLLGDVIDVLEKTAEAKKSDGGLAVLLDPAAVTLLAGVAIADGAKLDKALKQLVDEVQKNDEAAKTLKSSDETYQGIHLHTVSMPTPDQELAPLVGDTLDVVVGIADDKALVAVGRDAEKTLKKAIGALKSATGKEVPPLRIALAAKPIAKFLAEVGEDEQVKATASMCVAFLEKAGDKDHVTITANPIPRGVRLRLEVEEGLLKSLGSISSMMGGGMPPGGGN